MFKKIIAILVSAVLAFSFCACTVNIPALPQTETSNDLISTITSIIEYYSYYDVSEEELGKSILEDPDSVMYDDEEGVVAGEPEYTDDFGVEEVFVYDETENYDD